MSEPVKKPTEPTAKPVVPPKPTPVPASVADQNKNAGIPKGK